MIVVFIETVTHKNKIFYTYAIISVSFMILVPDSLNYHIEMKLICKFSLTTTPWWLSHPF